MRHILLLVLSMLLGATFAFAGNKEEERLVNCARVLEKFLKSDTIPQKLLDKAECVVVIPSVKKFTFFWGRSSGRGAVVCRTGEDFARPWGPPAMYALTGTSIGFQLGVKATDYVLLVMNPRDARSLLHSKVKLGADAAVVAGPKGRSKGRAATATDVSDVLRRPRPAEIRTYSRSRGLFAGVSMEGSTLRQDNKANKKVYGRKISAREIVIDAVVAVPQAGSRLVSLLQKASPTQ